VLHPVLLGVSKRLHDDKHKIKHTSTPKQFSFRFSKTILKVAIVKFQFEINNKFK